MNCVVFVKLDILNFIYSKKVLLYIYYAIIYVSSLSQFVFLGKKIGDRRGRDRIYNYLCNQCLSPLVL
jgi:hypothetical protein